MFATNKAVDKEIPVNSCPDSMVSEGDPITDAVRESARQFRESTREAAAAVKGDIETAAQQTSAHMRHFANSAERNFEDVGKAVANKIHRNPIQSSLIALGTGIVVGMLARRR